MSLRSERGEISTWLTLAAGLAVAATLAVSVLGPVISTLAHEVAAAAGLDVGTPPPIPQIPVSEVVGPEVEIEAEPEAEPVDCGAREVLDDGIVAVGAHDPAMAAFDQVALDILQGAIGPATNISVAVMRDGELLHSRAYSADGAPVAAPDSVYRIASVSKPITATAIMTLVDSGAVRLDAPISDYLDLGDAADSRMAGITVEDLLRHRGGFDRDASGDPMFAISAVAAHAGKDPSDLGPSDFINYMETQNLDFAPGTDTAYSNFGFVLLGQIIEQASGQSYESYVQEQVFAPMGIHDAHLGATSQSGSRPNEVGYVDPNVATYDNFLMEPMAANGGWVMSAEDLARFGNYTTSGGDGSVLSDEAREAMFSHRPGETSGFGLGWSVNGRNGNNWHGGSLPGTTTLMVNRPDGTTWVILINGRPADQAERNAWTNAIDQALHAAAAAVGTWPTDGITCA